MNKATYLKVKAHLVIIKFLIIILLFSSCKNEINLKNDYIIFNKIIEKTNSDKYHIIIKKSNNNEFVVSKISELSNATNQLKQDSLKQVYGIKNSVINNLIFNKNEYHFLITQKYDSIWDFDKISKKNKQLIKVSKKNLIKNKIVISKPIYTRDKKFALVKIHNKSMLYIQVFQNKNNEWIEKNLFSSYLSQRKVKLISK